METTTQTANRTIDVTGLPEEAIQTVESLVTLLRSQGSPLSGPELFSSRDEWIRAIREWASNHTPQTTSADWSRESIYAGRGE